MILETTYTKEWIENLRKQDDYKKADAANIEKMLYALLLLEKLLGSNLDFIFKGGTALVLLFEKPYRFSIDIDIITNKNQEQVEDKLNALIKDSLFTHWQLDEKRSYKRGIPKAHYKLFYEKGNFSLGKSVLLDVLFSDNPYPETVKLPVKSSLFDCKEPFQNVVMPSINSILGDKLTAFAPNTTGIKYNSGKEIEIIKQLFDISILIENCTDISITKEAFEKIASEEIKYRNLDITSENIIEDIFDTALIIAKRDKNVIEPERSKFLELQKGIKNIVNYLVYRNLKIEQAISASAKTAWFAEIMKQSRQKDFNLFQSLKQNENMIIKNSEYTFLNRLKKTNPEAFYYWCKLIEFRS